MSTQSKRRMGKASPEASRALFARITNMKQEEYITLQREGGRFDFVPLTALRKFAAQFIGRPSK